MFILEKISTFKNYRNNSSSTDLKSHLKYLQACLNDLIEIAKEKHYETVNNLKKYSEKFYY